MTAPPSAKAPATIFVVDDDPTILDLVARVCSPLDARIETFSSAADFLAVVSVGHSGCLILDYRLPDLNGLQILEELHSRGIELPAIFISGRAQVSTAVAAFKAGSMDFLEKPFEIDELRATAQRALDTNANMRRERAQRDDVGARVQSLTPRETQVMQLVVEGKANKTVAAELGVSPKTVEVHRSNVMQKMRASSLADLVRMVMIFREGTVSQDSE